jgi:dipeptidyl aminopeptidase/acylaminoacyl peptidase
MTYTVVGLKGSTIFSVPSTGGPSRKLTAGRSPAWSPDGQTLALVRGGLRPSIYTATSDGSGVRRILAGADAPAFSTKGGRLAFVRDRSLWVADADGAHAERVFRAAAHWSVASPTWAPDDTVIAFNYVKDVEAPNPTFAQVRTVAAPGVDDVKGDVLNRPSQNEDGWINGGVTLSWQPGGDQLLVSLLLGPGRPSIGTGAVPAASGGTGAIVAGAAYAEWAPDGRQYCLVGRAGLLRATFGANKPTVVVKDPAGGAVIGTCAWKPLA